MRGWLTAFERLPLFTTDGLEPNAEYYLRVRVRTMPRNALLFFWPWGAPRRRGDGPVHVHSLRSPERIRRHAVVVGTLPDRASMTAVRDFQPRPTFRRSAPRARRVGAPSVPRQPAADPRRHRPAARQPDRDGHAGRSLDRAQSGLPQRGRPLRAVGRRPDDAARARRSCWRATSSSWWSSGGAGCRSRGSALKLVAALLGLTIVPSVLVLLVGSELIRKTAPSAGSACRSPTC